MNDSSLNCSLVCPSPKPEVLEQREIEIVHVRSAQSVASHAAERSGGGLRERSRVEPLRDAVSASAGVADEIGAIGAEAVVQSAKIGRGDGQREPSLPGVDPVHLPAADQRLFHPGRITRDMFTVSKREVVDEAADQPMIDVEVGEAMIALGILVVRGIPASR